MSVIELTPQVGIERARDALEEKYASFLEINESLTRKLVSFQANKREPGYRWFNYKESFSAELVGYLLDHMGLVPGSLVLDPFAGIGTTLTVSAERGVDSVGIELHPVAISVLRARLTASTVPLDLFRDTVTRLIHRSTTPHPSEYRFPHLRITEKAFSDEAEGALAAFVGFLPEIRNHAVRYLFWFSALAVLESVSYTRKDGQYLRWDLRSGRTLRSSFSKGEISDFWTALVEKLRQIESDIPALQTGNRSGQVDIIEGSSLSELAELPESYFDGVITSPPYCNRYDYTRTYALELAYMGLSEQKVRELRQALLSATVENRTKRDALSQEYAARNNSKRFDFLASRFDNHPALQEVLGRLLSARGLGLLNNDSIPDMVANYFFEMNIIVDELARCLKPGGTIAMVNDNVRYHGEEVPVDLILSDFAEASGLCVEKIWVLPTGKGNSSQQMGNHGRHELRKCVYLWSKPH